MIKNVGIQQNANIQSGTQGVAQKNTTQNADIFKGILNSELGKGAEQIAPQAKAEETLKFSSHALDRIQNRGIRMMKEDVQKLNEAVDKASKKGSREALVIMGDNAFVVSVKNKTVITAVDKTMLKDNVFTNIDSTVFAG